MLAHPWPFWLKLGFVTSLGIVVALVVFYLAYQQYFNSPLNKELQTKKKALLREQKEINQKLEKIEQDLKNLKIKQ